LQKKPHLDLYLDGYEAKSKEDLEAVFGAGGEEVIES